MYVNVYQMSFLHNDSYWRCLRNCAFHKDTPNLEAKRDHSHKIVRLTSAQLHKSHIDMADRADMAINAEAATMRKQRLEESTLSKAWQARRAGHRLRIGHRCVAKFNSGVRAAYNNHASMFPIKLCFLCFPALSTSECSFSSCSNSAICIFVSKTTGSVIRKPKE